MAQSYTISPNHYGKVYNWSRDDVKKHRWYVCELDPMDSKWSCEQLREDQYDCEEHHPRKLKRLVPIQSVVPQPLDAEKLQQILAIRLEIKK